MVLGIPNPVGFTLFGDNAVTAHATAKKKKRVLRARIGDLAIAKFDDSSVVGIVTGVYYRDEYHFIYWDINKIETLLLSSDSLITRATSKPSISGIIISRITRSGLKPPTLIQASYPF